MLRSNIHIYMLVVKPVFQSGAILSQVRSRSYEQMIASSFIALRCYSSLEAVLSSHCCCCEVNTQLGSDLQNFQGCREKRSDTLSVFSAGMPEATLFAEQMIECTYFGVEDMFVIRAERL